MAQASNGTDTPPLTPSGTNTSTNGTGATEACAANTCIDTTTWCDFDQKPFPCGEGQWLLLCLLQFF